MALVARLLDRGRRVIAYDPKAVRAAQTALRRPFDTAPSAADCVRAASLVVVMTPWPEFRDIPAEAFSRSSSRVTVIDCWRVIPTEVGTVADVVYLGHGAATQRASVSA
jgi:UDPglucose 6-dehydrogenase